MKAYVKLLIISLLLSIGCKSKIFVEDNHNQAIKFKIKTIASDYKSEKTFFFLLPKGGKVEKLYPHDDRIYIEHRVRYKDGSIFYVSNNIWNSSRINAENLYKIGIQGYTKKALLDTVYYSGVQENERVWADNPRGEIIIGYANVPAEKKDEFENAIHSASHKNK